MTDDPQDLAARIAQLDPADQLEVASQLLAKGKRTLAVSIARRALEQLEAAELLDGENSRRERPRLL